MDIALAVDGLDLDQTLGGLATIGTGVHREPRPPIEPGMP